MIIISPHSKDGGAAESLLLLCDGLKSKLQSRAHHVSVASYVIVMLARQRGSIMRYPKAKTMICIVKLTGIHGIYR
jgi:hypothetical protein